jgi:hypothetical protein
VAQCILHGLVPWLELSLSVSSDCNYFDFEKKKQPNASFSIDINWLLVSQIFTDNGIGKKVCSFDIVSRLSRNISSTFRSGH